MTMEFDIITIFPEIVEAPLRKTILKRAIDEGILAVRVHQLRDFAEGPHRKVDDQPYGGGGGMVMKPEPVFKAVAWVEEQYPRKSSRRVLMSPQGTRFHHREAVRLSLIDRIILICGRYEGVDERIREALVDEEISIGDYVLTGGELPAMVMVDAISRLVPGVVGEGESVLRDSFAQGLLQYPQYTRPAEFQGLAVPEVLMSGRHAEIEEWRHRMALENTRNRRPDLIEQAGADEGASEGEAIPGSNRRRSWTS